MSFIRTMLHMYRARKDPVAYARSLGVKVGEQTRLLNIKPLDGTFGSEPYLVQLGNHVTVAAAVRFVTHDGGVWVFRDREPDIEVFGPISVGNNVFIGYGSILMPNVEIGNNVVIGACSIVTRNVPDNSVVAGVPAKVIKSIDSYYETIQSHKFNIRDLPEGKRREILKAHFYAGN